MTTRILSIGVNLRFQIEDEFDTHNRNDVGIHVQSWPVNHIMKLVLKFPQKKKIGNDLISNEIHSKVTSLIPV